MDMISRLRHEPFDLGEILDHGEHILIYNGYFCACTRGQFRTENKVRLKEFVVTSELCGNRSGILFPKKAAREDHRDKRSLESLRFSIVTNLNDVTEIDYALYPFLVA